VARLIVTPQILARLVAIVVLGVILQLSFFSGIHLLETSPDILPALVVVLGLLGGSMTGAVAGFSVGLLLDCLLVAPLGASSLVLLTVGYMAGIYRERFDLGSSLTPPLMCLGLTLFAEAAFAAVRLMLGVDAPISALVARDMVVTSIYAFFLGIPIFLGVRRALRPALITERTARGRAGALRA
jgi:rod shape-determining protein MreD